MFVCPHCGYAALESKFNDIKSSEIKIIKQNISSKWNSRDYGGERNFDKAIEAYKLALLVSNLLSYNKFEIGYICLNIAWLYRLRDKDGEESRFLSFARDQFKDAYYNEPSSDINMDTGKLTYLIGELSRRIDDREEALNWYSICLKDPTIKTNPELNNIVREQWRILRES